MYAVKHICSLLITRDEYKKHSKDVENCLNAHKDYAIVDITHQETLETDSHYAHMITTITLKKKEFLHGRLD